MTLREAIALFDMDGTICDYVKAMHEALEKLRAPGETFVDPFSLGDDGNNSRYKYLWDRMNLIKSEEEWWANLPIFPLGWEVMDVAKETGYYCEILTQAPKKNPASLAGKLKWIIKHEDKLGEDIDFTITRNKTQAEKDACGTARSSDACRNQTITEQVPANQILSTTTLQP